MTIIGIDMFNLVTQEHRMIRDAVGRLFNSLQAEDTERRQRDKVRIEGATVARALSDLGLFDTGADDIAMTSAQVQASVAIESGAAALPFPVLEALTTHALAMKHCTTTVSAGATRTLSSANYSEPDFPMLRDGRLNGVARLVPFVHLADHVVINAWRGGEMELVEVRLNDPNLTREARATVEPDYPLENLRFNAVVATPLAEGAQVNGADNFLQQRTALLAAAEIAGACRSMVAMTREYLLLRTQFGQVLAANQSLKHALADNHVRVEAMMAAIDYAAAAMDADDVDAEAAIFAAKHFAGRAGKAIADSTLQMHGAIGYTMEFPLHLLMRRVHRLTTSYGSNRTQADRLFDIFQRGCVND
jgi:hypothetical protein